MICLLNYNCVIFYSIKRVKVILYKITNFILKGINELISKKTTEMTSPLDLFPTLFHVLCEEEVAPALFQGESVFKDKRWPFVATARYNAGRTPYEFFLHDGKNKVVVQLADRSCPLSSKEIKLLSFTTADDKPLALSTDEVQQRFQSAFTRLFNLP